MFGPKHLARTITVSCHYAFRWWALALIGKQASATMYNKAYNKWKMRWSRFWRGWIRDLVITLIVVSCFRSAVADWNLKEKYTFDLKVVDEAGIAISGAVVIAIDENGTEIFSVSTGVDGTISQQQTLAKWWYFDPINNTSTLISENIYTTFDYKVSKSGYETYYSEGISLGKKIDATLALKPLRSSKQLKYITMA